MTPEDSLPALVLSSMRVEEQAEIRELILAGLAEHWGSLDPAKNPDLQDMQTSFPGAMILVARMDGQIVGTGTLVPRENGVAEIVRMSVATDMRRRGAGGLILKELILRARQAGFQKVILETTSSWTEAIAFYQQSGFKITHHRDGDTYFALELKTLA